MIGRGLSLWLDLLRVAATLAVLLSHLAYPRFTDGLGWARAWNIGTDAVIVFFVLSGFVIAHAAARDAAPGRYAFNRLTRLWSVLLPALLLTWGFDRLGLWLDPAAYPAPFYADVGLTQMLLRGLSFSSEWVTGSLRLGSNGPLWSLSYEAAYYAIFGAVVFLSGARRVAVVAALALLAGPRVLLLMPAWLMGVALYQWLQAGGLARVSPVVGWVLALGGPAVFLAGHALGWPAALIGAPALGFSQGWLWAGVVGACTTAHVAGIARLTKDGAGTGWRGAALIRWAAGASFSVYVTHYPALHLLDAALPDLAGRGAVLGAGSLAVGVIFAAVCERPLPIWRRLAARLGASLRVPSGSVALR